MTDFSLSQEQRQDLAILAGGGADESTTSRAQLLLSNNKEAVAYFDAMRRMTTMLSAELSSDRPGETSGFLPDDQVREIAARIQKRALRRRWTQRPWTIAASILLVLGTAVAVSRPLLRSRDSVNVHLFPLPAGLTSSAPDRWLQLHESQVLSTEREIGQITLPGRQVIIVNSHSSIRWEHQTLHVLHGQCYVQATDLQVAAGESRMRVSGELLVSFESDGGTFVDVYSGTATLEDRPGLIVQTGQRATLNPIQVTSITLTRPAWIKLATERSK